MNTKNKKLAIPAILVATVMVAGIFAFAPIENASTVHTEVIASAIGLACATETVTLTAGIDNDPITLTFTPAIQLLGLRVSIDDNADDIGFDADPTVNGAIIQTGGIFEDIDDIGTEIIGQYNAETTFSITAGGALVMIVEDDTGGAMAAADVITFQACGLVTDPANFGPASFLITGADVAE